MRRLIVLMGVSLMVACALIAGPEARQITPIELGAATGGTNTLAISGYVEAVYVSVSDGASTGAVTVSYAPHIGGNAVNLATNDVSDEKVWRPVVDKTSVAGTDLTSDEPARFPLAGETVSFVVTGSPTNLTWKCVLVLDQD